MTTTNGNNINMLYLGGTGHKVSKLFSGSASKEADHISAGRIPYFIDCSTSDAGLENSELELITIGTGGSGGSRGTNIDLIMAETPAVVNRIEKTPITVVVFSMCGGSGSSLAYAVVDALLNKGNSVVLMMTSTPDSFGRTQNAIKTMSSLDNLAKQHNVVLPAFIYDTLDKGYIATDTSLIRHSVLLGTMLSTTVRSVDDQDRKHFLNPRLVDTSIPAGLYGLESFVGNKYVANDAVASCLTLVPAGASDNIGTGTSVLFGGVLSKITMDAIIGEEDDKEPAISLLIRKKIITSYYDHVEKIGQKMNDDKEVAAPHEDISLPSYVKSETKGGFVL